MQTHIMGHKLREKSVDVRDSETKTSFETTVKK